REEGARQLGHERLALVHRVHDVQLGEVLAASLAVDHEGGDDPDDLAATGERPVGERAHQATSPAAVDDTDPALGQDDPDVMGHLQPLRVVAGCGAGEARQSLDHPGTIAGRGEAEIRWRRSPDRGVLGGMTSSDVWTAEQAQRYDEEGGMFSDEVLAPTVEGLAALADGGAALEMAIGTGRVAVPLRAKGVPVAGIELSP